MTTAQQELKRIEEEIAKVESEQLPTPDENVTYYKNIAKKEGILLGLEAGRKEVFDEIERDKDGYIKNDEWYLKLRTKFLEGKQ